MAGSCEVRSGVRFRMVCHGIPVYVMACRVKARGQARQSEANRGGAIYGKVSGQVSPG